MLTADTISQQKSGLQAKKRVLGNYDDAQHRSNANTTQIVAVKAKSCDARVAVEVKNQKSVRNKKSVK